MKKMILLWLLISLAFAKTPKRAITFEDFFSMKRMGSVSVQPKGDLVAFDVTLPLIDQNSFSTHIWILNTTSGAVKKITTGDTSCSGPIWSPNGQWLYYHRQGQIWKMRPDGSQAQQVTSFPTGASAPVFAPDGQSFIFRSRVFPDCASIPCLQHKLDSLANSKVKARIIDHLFYRHWNHWLEGKRSHLFLSDLKGQHIKDITPGDYDTPPLDLGSGHDYAFSPDGREICFVRNTDPLVAASTNNDLFLYDLKKGTTTRLTHNKGNDCAPHYSPDGRYLAYTSMARPGFEADRRRLMLYDRKDHSLRELTLDFPYSVSSILWQQDSKAIYFTVSEKGSHSLYRVSIESNHITPILKGHYITSVQWLNKDVLLFKEQNEAMPYELFSLNLTSGERKQLTHLNSDLLDQLVLSRLEPFAFVGAKGDTVHGFIMKPPFFKKGKKYPAIELIHGGPQGAWGNDFHYRWNYQMFAAPGYVVFMINFHGSSGYGQPFTDAVSKDWGGAPYQDILMGTRYVFDHFDFIDTTRVGAAGASYGGFMINWIAGAPHPFKALVSHDGVYEQVSMYGATEELWFPEWEFNGTPWQKGSLYQKWNPANRAANFHTPMLVIHGENDFRVPYTQGLQLFTALQRQGVPSKLLFFPDEDHFVTKPQNARLWWKTVHEWFKTYLK